MPPLLAVIGATDPSMLGTAALVALVVALVLSGPWFPFARAWGYWPLTGLIVVLAVWIGLIWFGWIVIAWPGV
jgi:hypothetical protein